MSPAFLLDEHISPRVAKILLKRGVNVQAVAAFSLAGMEDLELLRWAVREKRILVTYDTGDFSLHVAALALAGTDIPGVVFVNAATIPSKDILGLAQALERLAARIGTGKVDPSGGVFLTR